MKLTFTRFLCRRFVDVSISVGGNIMAHASVYTNALFQHCNAIELRRNSSAFVPLRMCWPHLSLPPALC